MNVACWRSAKLGDIVDRLGDCGWARSFVERAPDIAVSSGGALLWTCVRRGRGGDELANALFDSFFARVPPGARAVAEQGHIVLPRLGVHVRRAPMASLEKADDRSVIVGGTERAGELWELAALPEHARIETIPTGFAQCVLVDVVAIEQLTGRGVELTDMKPGIATERISAGLALIELAGKAISDRLREHVQFAVPIASESNERKSYTYRDAPGIVFVSPGAPPDWLAEAIVHEAAHIELAARIEHNSPFFPKEGERFYSPWKNEPRPAEAVLHGAFSFWRTAEYLVERMKRGCATDGTMSRAFQTLYRVRLALGQLTTIDATADGADLIDAIERSVRELSCEVPRAAEMPLSVRVHVAAWMRRHPDLAGGLRPPVE